MTKVAEIIAKKVFSLGKQVLISNINELEQFKDNQEVKGFVLVALPVTVHSEIVGVLDVWFNKANNIHLFPQTVLEMLSTLSTQAGIVLENKLLLAKTIKQLWVADELEIAKKIQNAILQNGLPNLEGLKLYACSETAYEVGGDYFDVIVSDNKKCLIAIGDVSGKGIPAALMVNTIHSAIQFTAQIYTSPDHLLRMVNSITYNDLNRLNMFVTVFISFYDSETKKLIYSNAGHCYPLLYRRSTRTYEFLKLKGIMLGGKPDHDFKLGETNLQDGDVVVFYTDGAIEAQNEQGELFGKERFTKTVIDAVEQCEFSIEKDIISQIKLFVGEKPLNDDISLIVLRIEEEQIGLNCN